MLCIAQFVPFHTSAQVWVVDVPTASHEAGDAQDTELSWVAGSTGGLGVVWTVQLVPSQRSANVDSVPPPVSTSPTAVHAFAPVQDTASRLLLEALGVLVMNQAWPLKISASASNTPPVGSSPPTAAQKAVDGQDTASRLLASGLSN